MDNQGLEAPDTQPGHYYVCVQDTSGHGKFDFRLLAGPYTNDHAGALADVGVVRRLACELDARAHWYAFGTCRLPLSEAAPVGILNGRLREPVTPAEGDE